MDVYQITVRISKTFYTKEERMKKLALIISVFMFFGLCAVAVLAQDEAPEMSPMEKADALYNQKTMDSVKEAVTIYESLMEGNEEAAWKFARAAYWVGVRTTGKDAQEAIFDKAYNAVKPYFDAGTTNINTNYWFALCAGKYGKLHGIVQSLFLVKPMKTACERVINQDEGYEDGSALVIYGAIEYEVPGGDKDVTVDYCNRALKYDPDGISTNLYLAKAYYDMKEYAKAKERLDHLIANGKPETKDDKADMAEAEELLAKVNEKM